MNLHDAVTAAFNKQWSMSNTFTIEIHPSGELQKTIGQFDESLNLHIVSFKTPDFKNAGISAFIANSYKINSTKDDLYSWSMEIRDHNQLEFYKKFYTMYQYSKEEYFDTAKFTINVLKDADWANEKPSVVMVLEDCLITGISNLDFNNESEARVIKFSVEGVSASPNIII